MKAADARLRRCSVEAPMRKVQDGGRVARLPIA
jgi:hypothetical protein